MERRRLATSRQDESAGEIVEFALRNRGYLSDMLYHIDGGSSPSKSRVFNNWKYVAVKVSAMQTLRNMIYIVSKSLLMC